jgi:8-oxo-dGTP diphosphatase
MDVAWRRAAAYVVCRDEADRLLLTRFVSAGHPDSGMWTMPGGGMEWGESAEAAAHRELAEETGLTATLGPVLGIFSRWFTEDESAAEEPGHLVGIVFSALDVHGALRTTFEAGSTDAARWFDLDEISHLAHVELVDFVVDLLAIR